MNCHLRDTTPRNVPRCEQRGKHNQPMPLTDDHRLMRITGLDRSPDPRLNTLTDAGLLDLLDQARAVRDRRRASTQGDEPLAAGWGR